MKNIELKVQVNEFGKFRRLLRAMKAKPEGVLNQVDTYFNSKKGRMKIREMNHGSCQLIFYQRPNRLDDRVSNYEIIDLGKKRCATLKNILALTNNNRVVVKKKRELWIYKHTRIHLDQVDKFGKYLELETVQKKISEGQAKQEFNQIVNKLLLGGYKKIKSSYSDM